MSTGSKSISGPSTWRLAHDLPDKLKSELRRALAKQLIKQESESSSPRSRPRCHLALELLAFFAATGTLPWWADFSNSRFIPETLECVARARPDRLAGVMCERSFANTSVGRASFFTLTTRLCPDCCELCLRFASLAAELQQQTEAIPSTWPHLSGSNVTRVRIWFWLAVVRQAARVHHISSQPLGTGVRRDRDTVAR